MSAVRLATSPRAPDVVLSQPLHEELLGRTQERQRLSGLLRDARGGDGGAVIIRGEAGIGKSALADELADNAEGFCVQRVVGVESEMELP
jgi:predicted ATP-dependent serine protease